MTEKNSTSIGNEQDRVIENMLNQVDQNKLAEDVLGGHHERAWLFAEILFESLWDMAQKENDNPKDMAKDVFLNAVSEGLRTLTAILPKETALKIYIILDYHLRMEVVNKKYKVNLGMMLNEEMAKAASAAKPGDKEGAREAAMKAEIVWFNTPMEVLNFKTPLQCMREVTDKLPEACLWKYFQL